jgi:hypothetical protein
MVLTPAEGRLKTVGRLKTTADLLEDEKLALSSKPQRPFSSSGRGVSYLAIEVLGY